jgi:hypothetical protein
VRSAASRQATTTRKSCRPPPPSSSLSPPSKLAAPKFILDAALERIPDAAREIVPIALRAAPPYPNLPQDLLWPVFLVSHQIILLASLLLRDPQEQLTPNSPRPAGYLSLPLLSPPS